jgi:hypothetical protein
VGTNLFSIPSHLEEKDPTYPVWAQQNIAGYREVTGEAPEWALKLIRAEEAADG